MGKRSKRLALYAAVVIPATVQGCATTDVIKDVINDVDQYLFGIQVRSV